MRFDETSFCSNLGGHTMQMQSVAQELRSRARFAFCLVGAGVILY